MYFTDHHLHSPNSKAEDLTPSLKAFYDKKNPSFLELLWIPL